MADWSLLTTHGRVLLIIAEQPDARLRDIADALGISERWAHRVVGDLTDAGYVTKRRVGRRNRYEIQSERALQDALVARRTVGDVLSILAPAGTTDHRADHAPRR